MDWDKTTEPPSPLKSQTTRISFDHFSSSYVHKENAAWPWSLTNISAQVGDFL